jgi:polar amino acid transport system ATP-binding protein
MLKLNALTKTYHGKNILDHVSLNVGKGEVAILLGSSGVGKSTLLRILNNLESLDSGSITLDGKPLDLQQVNKDHTVGIVFQNFNLFEHLTVQENITLALEKTSGKSKKEAQAIARALLKRYGLEDKANNYVTQLSGGQKQRLAIARTLALKPKIVCTQK